MAQVCSTGVGMEIKGKAVFAGSLGSASHRWSALGRSSEARDPAWGHQPTSHQVEIG